MMTDSFFHVGVAHEVCQDYAAHGDNYVVISDGCSSAPNSDWGARLLCKSFQNGRDTLDKLDTDNFIFILGGDVKRLCRQLELPNEALTATLLFSRIDKEFFRTTIIGDGVVGGVRKDGSFRFYVYEPTEGGCFYLKYQIFNEQEKYKEQFKGTYKITCYDGKPQNFLVHETIIEIDLGRPYFECYHALDEFEMVFVGSDGLTQFFRKVHTETSKHTEPVDVGDVLGVLLDVPKRNDFLRFQRNWAFRHPHKDAFTKRQWYNADDVSLAAIRRNP